MHSSFLARLIFLFSLLQLLVLASSSDAAAAGAKLAARQADSDAPSASSPECLDYEWTANMSTIGKNGSYRTAFLQKSNVGTIYNARMMDAAIAKLPKMTADQALNDACGNWTTIAHEGAIANYSEGIVAQFTTDGLPHGIKAGPIILVVVGCILILFSTIWVFIV